MIYPELHRDLPEPLVGLDELALDLRWNWSHATDPLWKMLDEDAWESTRNPYLILLTVSRERLARAATNEEITRCLKQLLERRHQQLESPSWFEQCHGRSALKHVAYFSMEFGLGEALPIYSGGLGLLAGDHLKTASDLGIPLVGIGLLYQQGYFRQMLGSDGSQLDAFPYNDPVSLPITPVPDKEIGGWLRIELPLPGRIVRLRVWKARVGRIALYLLDSNDPLNSLWDRSITANLYPQESEQRLLQEIVLGVCGFRLLRRLGIEAQVCHINEGHAALTVIGRALSFMEENGGNLESALWATRRGNIFTTHTPLA